MPPLSPPRSPDGLHDPLSELSEEDFDLLYEIVNTAQGLSDVEILPFRALFAAYEEVLVRHGIDPDQDQIYLRFLFRLGQSRREDQTLLEAFEALLLQLGFAVLHDDDEEDENEEENDGGGKEPAAEEEGDTSVLDGAGRRRSRRASFSSFYDAEDESAKAPRNRPSSRASLSRLQDNSQGFGAREFVKKKTARQEAAGPQRRASAQQREDRRLKPDSNPKNVASEKKYQSSGSWKGKALASQSSASSPKKQAPRKHTLVPDVFIYQDTDESDSGVSRQELTQQDAIPSQLPVPIELLYYPSETQLLRDADTFEHFSIRRVARRMLRKWKNLTQEIRERHEDMEQKAADYDKGALTRQAFDQWHQEFRVKRQEVETERFFMVLERRAGKARDLYLLAKAFTHWAECAAEQVADNAVARRHIIRFRYFNAWKEITAVNELKVRRHTVKKFFAAWKQRFNTAGAKDHAAVTLYQGNLAERIYWRWFWEFCERRAPEWRIARLKRRHFFRWMDATRSSLIQDNRVIDSSEVHLKKKHFAKWIEKACAFRAQQQQAVEFKRRQTVANALPVWRLQLRYAPLAQQVTARVDHRVVSNAFHTLVHHYNLEYQAEEFNRKRIVMDAWRAWNHNLRCQTLQNQISDRLAMQALYKWVIAERGVLMARMHDERLKRQTLRFLVDRLKALTVRNEETRKEIEDSRRVRSLKCAMKKWRSKKEAQEERNKVAFQFDSPRIAQESLHIWYAKSGHLTQLDNWATEAAYYFRAKRSIMAWRNAVVGNQKQKIRDAYSRTRRKHKMNLARGLLTKWREKSSHVRSLNEAAQDVVEQRTRAQVPVIFAQWQTRFSQIESQDNTAINHFHANQLTMAVQTWSNKLQLIQENNIQAQSFDRSHLEKPTSDCLRKLHLKVLGIRSLDSRAESFYLWKQTLHARAFLSIWFEKTGRRVGRTKPQLDNEQYFRSSLLLRGTRTPRPTRRGPTATFSNLGDLPFDAQTLDITSPSHRSPPDPLGFNPASDAADWIPPPTDQLQPFATPGILNTPSKRAARARALVLGTASKRGPVAFQPISESEVESTTPASPSRQARGVETPLSKGLFGGGRPATGPPVEGRVGFTGTSAGKREDGVRRSLFERR